MYSTIVQMVLYDKKFDVDILSISPQITMRPAGLSLYSRKTIGPFMLQVIGTESFHIR